MKRSVKRRKPPPKKKGVPEPAAREDLNATSRAVYGIDDGREVPAQGNESIEDPLADWPESAAEADRWLSGRGARRDEQREG